MAEPVGDLVVDLSLDAARFDEQMARVRRHFSGTESDAKKTAAVVEQSLSRQALAAQKAGISVGQYKAGPPRWRWRPVRWRMPGIRVTQPCPISTKRWSFPAISRV